MFKRKLLMTLNSWKENEKRKPLILRGARQVGKTTLVNQFSESYEHFISLNLERPSDIQYFKDFKDAKTLVDALLVQHSISSAKLSKTLLFIDEIQESTEAISLLRYFYEDVEGLHVIAAGSLLEHELAKVKSFPVGRIDFLNLYPLNFLEFLEAINQNGALEQIEKVPVQNYAHRVLLGLFNKYAIIGGMPEVVSTYLRNESVADLPTVYESIWGTYKKDVEKYAKNEAASRVIRHIMGTAHLYVDQRIKFQNFGNSNYKSREVSEAFRSLNDARVIQIIYPTTETHPPILPDIKKSPRLQFLDTGLLNSELNIQADMLALEDLTSAYKGAIIPHLIFQEYISLQTLRFRQPNFWVREKTQSSSELDLVVQHQNMLIPIEIKSGAVGSLRSLHQFVENTDHHFAIRMYSGEFGVEKHETPTQKKPYYLMNLPYYLGAKLAEYVAYFVENYSTLK